jgi:hypothetical protein
LQPTARGACARSQDACRGHIMTHCCASGGCGALMYTARAVTQVAAWVRRASARLCALQVRSMYAPCALHLRRSTCAPAGRHVRSRSLAHPHLPAELRLSWHRLWGPQHVRASQRTPTWIGPTVLRGAVAHCCTAAATYQQKVRRLTFSMTSVRVPVACFFL